jgi:small subunit ribosomal protein S1
MESNNPNLGDDVRVEELAPEPEHTTAETQDTPELTVEKTQAELLDEAVVDDEVPAASEVVDAEEDVEYDAVDEETAVVFDAVDAEEEIEDDAVDEETAVVFDAVSAEEEIEDEAEEEAEAASDAISAEEDVEDETVDEETAVVFDEDDVEDTGEPFEEDVEDEAEEETETSKAPFRQRDVIEGTVIETSPTEVLVQLTDELVGVVASRELERMDRAALEALKIGSPVHAYVLKMKGQDGRPVLSLARAEEENNWRLAEQHYQNKDVYFSKVAGYNKGGLIVRFGKVRGFVPASQISRERQQRASGNSPEERWGHMVGEDIAVKVVEIDRARNRLILSERAAAREWREKQKSRLLEDLTVGEVRTGRVISVADFGAFVDLGGADGLVHLTEITWQHITHPREVLEVGQEVEVQVINIDRENKRIGLSMKRQEDDPWLRVVKQYEIGQLVQATVTKLTKFGAFARLVDAPEIEGLIHISELADYRVSHPREVVLVGDVVTLRIIKINIDQRRLGLSLRQVDSAKFMDQDWQSIADEFEAGHAEAEPAVEETVEPAVEETVEPAVEETDDDAN